MATHQEMTGKRLYDAFMALKPSGLAETDWAVAAGVNRGFFTNLKGKVSSPRSDTVRKLLSHIGATQHDLEAAAAGKSVTVKAIVQSDRQPTRSVDGGETGAVIKLDLRLPMGPGASVDDYVEEEPFEFDLAYIRSFSRAPLSRLRIAEGVGDSMFPTLVSADLVWIDTTQNQLLHSDRIYAASINGGAAIKRLRPVDGGKRVLVISDNKTVDSYEVDAKDVAIWGRVIRFTRDL